MSSQFFHVSKIQSKDTFFSSPKPPIRPKHSKRKLTEIVAKKLCQNGQVDKRRDHKI